MKRMIAAIAAAIGFAMGASAATFDLANVTKNTSFPNGSVLTGTHGGGCQILIDYDTGKKSKGKAVYYKPTCSTVVLQNTKPDAYYQLKNFQGSVDLYFAPSAGNNFPGYADHVTVQP